MLLADGENSQADSEAYVAPLSNEAAPASETENKTAANESATPDLTAQEEAVASARGWKPKDEFRGDASTWLPAKDFLDRNASLQTDVRELKTQLEQRERQYMDKLERIERVTEKVVRQTREEAQRQIDASKRAAVELGDTVEYDRLEQEEVALYDRFRKEDEAARPVAKQEENSVTLLPETATWIKTNPWFNTNKALNQVALGFYEEAGERFVSEADKLKFVDERLGTVYPERFPEKRAKQQAPNSQMPSLEGGNRMPGAQTATAAQLPAEARAAAERFIKKGIIKTVDEYAKMYFED